jgi:hypothetical protein
MQSLPTRPRTVPQILRSILDLLPTLFITITVIWSATTLFWTRANPTATTTVLFTSTPISARELATTVLCGWIAGGVKMSLAFMRSAVYWEMWRQEFEYTLDWAAFDTCVGGLVAVVVVPFVMWSGG